MAKHKCPFCNATGKVGPGFYEPMKPPITGDTIIKMMVYFLFKAYGHGPHGDLREWFPKLYPVADK